MLTRYSQLGVTLCESKMAHAYHHEALRKQRVLDRKEMALQNLQNDVKEKPVDNNTCNPKGTRPFNTDPAQFEQTRSSHQGKKQNRLSQEGVVFDEIIHDPNFKYRCLLPTGDTPIHVDPIYRILYPGKKTE